MALHSTRQKAATRGAVQLATWRAVLAAETTFRQTDGRQMLVT